ncbi:MAG: hypothetical protein ABSA11_12180 [Candidatus Bathyarchaeia archaeon]
MNVKYVLDSLNLDQIRAELAERACAWMSRMPVMYCFPINSQMFQTAALFAKFPEFTLESYFFL